MIDNNLKAFITKKFPGQIINSILDLGKYYVINLTTSGLRADEFILDNLYRVDKNLKKVTGFTLEDDRQAYLNALKNPVYIRGKSR